MPFLSVPSQCADDGGWNRASRSIAFGSNGAIHGPSTPASTNTASMTSPTHALGDSRGAPPAAANSFHSGTADPRIGEAVGEIDGEVDHDVHHRDHEHAAL